MEDDGGIDGKKAYVCCLLQWIKNSQMSRAFVIAFGRKKGKTEHLVAPTFI